MRAERARAAPPPPVRLRETKPWNLVRARAIADAAYLHFPLEVAFGPSHACMQVHQVHVAALVGDDTPPTDRPAEAFYRTCRHVPLPVAPGVTLDAAARDENGHVIALTLRGDQLPPVPMPAHDEAQRLHTRLMEHERAFLVARPGIGPLLTRDEQQAARHAAWRALVEEQSRTEEHHRKNRGQIERELAATLPGWAAALGYRAA